MEDIQKTVLIIPPNDAEAILIEQIARKLGLSVITSGQTHGASLDEGSDVIPKLQAGDYEHVVVVEMPGPKTEQRIRELGYDLKIIDHHHYTDLDRAHDPKTGEMLLSSMEQFLAMFNLTDDRLRAFGFDPLLVRGIGIMDRGYIWQLQEEGCSHEQIKRILAYRDELTSELHNPKYEEHKWKMARRAWEKRQTWDGFTIVRSRANVQLRPRLSRIVFEEVGRPVPMIIIEWHRKLIYVQESDFAMGLFKRFGGFTFGQDRNWGHQNTDMNTVTLEQVKQAITELRS